MLIHPKTNKQHCDYCAEELSEADVFIINTKALGSYKLHMVCVGHIACEQPGVINLIIKRCNMRSKVFEKKFKIST